MRVPLGSVLAVLMAASLAACAEQPPRSHHDQSAQNQTTTPAPTQTTGTAPDQTAVAVPQAAPSDRSDRAERRAQRRAGGADRGDRGGQRAGHAEHQRQFAAGDRVPQKFLAGRHVVTDYARRGLQPPERGYQWVKARKQLLLVNADGVVKNVVIRHHRRDRDRDRNRDRDQDQDQTDN